jgi:hypothetical protein
MSDMPETERQKKLAEMRERVANMDPQLALDRITDGLVEDIMAMTDEEILAEAKEDGIDLEAETARVKAIIQAAIDKHDQIAREALNPESGT